MNFNTVPKIVRDRALQAFKPPVNPYLFDVRDDPELRSLLNNTAGTDVQVLLPVGAYLVKRFNSLTDRWAAGPEWTGSTWVLVGQTGLSTWCYEKLDEEYPDLWPEKVQKFLGIERKTRQKVKKTKAVKKTKKGRKA
jgi:hypothetical protein